MPRIITFAIGDKVQLKHSVVIDASRLNLSHHPDWIQDLICKSDLTGLLGTIVAFQDKSTTNKVRGKQYCAKILVRYETVRVLAMWRNLSTTADTKNHN